MNKRIVIVMQGVPGSGKTTMAKEYIRSLPLGETGHIVSADDYYMRDGVYRFDPSLLSKAHAYCFRRFIDIVSSTLTMNVIVDNTNTTAVEMAPYMLGASAYGYEPHYWRISCDPRKAAARNIHGVPEQVVDAQYQRMMSDNLAPWWKTWK